MKKSAVRMAIICFALAVSGNTKAADATPTAPSAINEIEQLTKPLSGTLFFDPGQRASMDRTRKHPVVVSDGDSDGVIPERAPSVVNGFVKRSDEKITVWVDGQMRNDVRSQAAQVLRPEDVGGVSTSIKVIDTVPISKLSGQSVKPKSAKKRVTSRKAAKRPAKK